MVHTAHDYHLICPRAFLLTRDWRMCTRPALPCRAYRAWHLRTAAYVDLFISPSQFLLEKHREAGLAAAATAVVRNGIPRPPSAPRRPAVPGSGNRFLLLCRLTEEKGLRVVLDAVRRLPRDLAFELTIAGRGPLEAVAQAAAAADSRIRFAGFVQNEAKHALLSQADHLLIPSLWYENAPVAVVEAAAYGIGVIGSRIGGIPELVIEGTTGFLFEPGDAGSLACIMRGLAAGERHLERLPEAAAAVAARHDIGTMVEAYLRHYSALDSHAARALAAGKGRTRRPAAAERHMMRPLSRSFLPGMIPVPAAARPAAGRLAFRCSASGSARRCFGVRHARSWRSACRAANRAASGGVA